MDTTKTDSGPSTATESAKETIPTKQVTRFKGIEHIKKSKLIPHPKNWRSHDESQTNALSSMMKKIGVISPIIARKIENSDEYQIIDGHLRHEIASEEEVAVLVVDLSEKEALEALLSFDPISEMAGINIAELDDLLKTTELPEAMDETINEIKKKAEEQLKEMLKELKSKETREEEAIEEYKLLVTVETEEEQEQLYEELSQSFKVKLIAS